MMSLHMTITSQCRRLEFDALLEVKYEYIKYFLEKKRRNSRAHMKMKNER